MRAIVFDEFGGRDRLHLTERPRPEPGPGEVRIAVAAAGVNPVDWKLREGKLADRLPHEFPVTPGWDAAGVVDRVGEGVDDLAPGDEVYTYCRLPTVHAGAYAEFVAVPAAMVARKPANLTLEHAAAVPLAALTAWQALVDSAEVRGGEHVLVHAAAGGVGHFAVQIAGHRNARVFGTASRGNHPFLEGLGVERTFDYANLDFRQRVRDIEPDMVVDVVLDTVGGETLTRSAELLREGGRLVSIVDPDGVAALADRGVDARFVFVEPDGAELAHIARLIEEGDIVPHVSEVLPLAEAARAHELSEAGHVRGKLVLAVS